MPKEPLKNILLVEDDSDIQEVAKMALSIVGGFNVVVCSSGAEALERVKEFSPQLILLDVMMPEMDGIMTFEKLRKIPQTETTPVIFMTAKVQPHEVAAYKTKGAQDVIAKPFDPMSLSKILMEIWEESGIEAPLKGRQSPSNQREGCYADRSS